MGTTSVGRQALNTASATMAHLLAGTAANAAGAEDEPLAGRPVSSAFTLGSPTDAGDLLSDGGIAALTGQLTDIHPVRQLFGLTPVFTALPLASVYAGVHAATAAILDLREREAGRAGSRIEAPLIGAAVSAMSSVHLHVEDQPARYDAPRLPTLLRRAVLPILRRYAAGGADREAKVLAIARKAYPALMTSYPCQDGRLLYLFAVDNPKLARRAVEALGLVEEVARAGLVFGDPYREERRDDLAEASNLTRKRQGALKAMVADALATRDAEEWERVLNEAGVPAAMQRTLEEWATLPAVTEAGLTALGADGSVALGPSVWRRDDLASPTPAAPKAALPARAADQWLSGVTVLDLCSMVAGPVATRTLAEYGARVIKVEPPRPNHGPRLTCWYALDVGQGKESVLLDLKTEGGRAAFGRLSREADVLMTNHAPAALDAMGLTDDALARANPRLIRCRVGAYDGPEGGPWADRPAYDPVLQAASGIMTRYGDEGAPELHAIASCVDALTGYLAAFAVCGALRDRDRDGQGRAVATSLAAAATLIQAPLLSGATPDVGGQDCLGTSPTHRLYRTKDGWLFLDAAGLDPNDLPRALRPGRQGDPADGIARKTRRRTTDEALRLLAEAGVPAVPVRCVADMQDDLLAAPEVAPVRLLRRDVAGVGPVVTAAPGQVMVNDAPLVPLASAEKPGASTRAVLAELGLDAEALIASGAATTQLADAFLPG